MSENLYLISDVAKRLDVPPHRVAYLFLTRKLAEPKMRLGNRRIFTEADVRRVCKALGRTAEVREKEACG
ncbi:MAG TPA: MerR family transcriptional regulator [Gemmataceae bacterium]|nr:MerR family transcriptional regulator [Gemmataceae bacterium]